MKTRFGDRFIYDWLTETQVKKRFEACKLVSRTMERIACSLEAAQAELSTPNPHPKVVADALEAAKKGAITMKTTFWEPEDRSAYNLEHSTKQTVDRIRKATVPHGRVTTISDKALPRLRKTLTGLKAKARKLGEDRIPTWCGLRRFEGIVNPPKE